MRIVGGEFRGRALRAPEGLDTRPTSDRTREAIFNILNHAPWCPTLSGLHVLDVFAGSGALGLEALSHGAAQCQFIEHNRTAQKAIEANIKTLGLQGRAVLKGCDIANLPPLAANEVKYDLIFMDPPYRKGLGDKALTCLGTGNWLKDEAIIVYERAKDEGYFATEVWDIIHSKIYGIAEVLFLRKKFI